MVGQERLNVPKASSPISIALLRIIAITDSPFVRIDLFTINKWQRRSIMRRTKWLMGLSMLLGDATWSRLPKRHAWKETHVTRIKFGYHLASHALLQN
jgi:hypothetical protein